MSGNIFTVIGTKVLKVEAMNRLAYNELRGWDLPIDENPLDDGYLVEYEVQEGSKPNVEGYAGYVSWSPKEVLEGSYSSPKDRVSLEEVQGAIKEVITVKHGSTTALTTVVMQNGFEIMETSACVSPETFNLKIGEEINLEKIQSKIWFLLGYQLKEQIHQINKANFGE